ncbi:hypothetical protein [Nocardia sp. NPDC050710]|uniref:hypothetical protein n=1 Tax=Nocardia sp. NPDC050710 TaxID=3157220 RepID=UPI003402EE12
MIAAPHVTDLETHPLTCHVSIGPPRSGVGGFTPISGRRILISDSAEEVIAMMMPGMCMQMMNMLMGLFNMIPGMPGMM